MLSDTDIEVRLILAEIAGQQTHPHVTTVPKPGKFRKQDALKAVFV
jgi:hypothetical protein